ncbi:PREDICTED: uncharacterized protein LOC106807034 isoform X2 [Priapulus caudatus]|uniref:Uncharacterized protein LOC106807034 isoform X2 n=1 Tax=Priapulus caudatus TaxID=37621 RepID=A0ABM1DXR4_PRICU|nr:PREDICTED: uncharacterized protein LOC106807034 isoform X2 [Priapulus caudatus]
MAKQKAHGTDMDVWYPNMKGLYTVCITCSTPITVDEIRSDFCTVGNIREINQIQSYVFVRYGTVAEAEAALNILGSNYIVSKGHERQQGQPNYRENRKDYKRPQTSPAIGKTKYTPTQELVSENAPRQVVTGLNGVDYESHDDSDGPPGLERIGSSDDELSEEEADNAGASGCNWDGVRNSTPARFTCSPDSTANHQSAAPPYVVPSTNLNTSETKSVGRRPGGTTDKRIVQHNAELNVSESPHTGPLWPQDSYSSEKQLLFCTNLSDSTSEDQLRHLFREYNPTSITINRPQQPGDMYFAVITFRDPTAKYLAKQAIDGVLISGHIIEVSDVLPTPRHHTNYAARGIDPDTLTGTVSKLQLRDSASFGDSHRHSRLSSGDWRHEPTSGGYQESTQTTVPHTMLDEFYYGMMKCYNMNYDPKIMKTLPYSFTVVITHVEDGCHFWGQIMHETTMGDISEILSLQRGLNMLHEKPLPKNVKFCAAPYMDAWFRAYPIRALPGDRTEVFYIDYGNTAVLPRSELISIPIHFIKQIRPLAVPFKLADVSENNNIVRHVMRDMMNTPGIRVELVRHAANETSHIIEVKAYSSLPGRRHMVINTSA